MITGGSTDPAVRERLRILVVGTGGQGVLTAARHLGEAARLSGREVVLGQLHGMSQRGGSVESTVLVGFSGSSFIEAGEADVVLGLEPLEVLRARPRMSAATLVVTNTVAVSPHLLAQLGKPYPELDVILAGIRAVTPRVTAVDGAAILRDVGVPRVLNIAMLGALSRLGALPFDAELLWSAIEADCPPKYLAANRRAFERGIEAGAG